MKDSGIMWIGKIPEDWTIKLARRLFYEVKAKNSNGEETNAFSFKYGEIVKKEFRGDDEKANNETIQGYTIVQPGTIIINGLNLSFDFITQRVGQVKEQGIITSAYLAVFPNCDEIEIPFATYLLKSYDACQTFHSMGKGIRKTLGFNEFKRISIIFPKLEIQNDISKYLDIKCNLINDAITTQQQAIEKLLEYKRALITRVVTKGLNFNIPLKKGNNRWFDGIPHDWQIMRLKFLLEKIIDCPHETPIYTSDGDYLVIRTADQDIGALRQDDNMYRLNEEEYRKRIRRLSLNKDDIVYGREGERWGIACKVPASGKYCLGQRMMQFRCDTSKIIPEFAIWALNSSSVYVQGTIDTIGSTSPHVNISTMRNYMIPIPPVEIQKSIADYLDNKCASINVVISKKQSLIQKLQEYKKSLIYECVTGKREV